MRHRQTRPHHELDDKVPITHAVETVLGDGIKSELFREEFTVHSKGVSGEGSRSQRKDRDARNQLPQALKIGREVESMGENKM